MDRETGDSGGKVLSPENRGEVVGGSGLPTTTAWPQGCGVGGSVARHDVPPMTAGMFDPCNVFMSASFQSQTSARASPDGIRNAPQASVQGGRCCDGRLSPVPAVTAQEDEQRDKDCRKDEAADDGTDPAAPRRMEGENDDAQRGEIEEGQRAAIPRRG